MTAKEYLSQVRRLEKHIWALLDRQRKYHEMGAWRASYEGAVGPEAMRALERELDRRITEYVCLHNLYTDGKEGCVWREMRERS